MFALPIKSPLLVRDKLLSDTKCMMYNRPSIDDPEIHRPKIEAVTQ